MVPAIHHLPAKGCMKHTVFAGERLKPACNVGMYLLLQGQSSKIDLRLSDIWTGLCGTGQKRFQILYERHAVSVADGGKESSRHMLQVLSNT